jgi:acetolactate synthase-1/2/3 large subunit
MNNKLKVSDIIAEFLKKNKIKCIFGIIGSANSHIYDSIKRLGYTEIVCVHHEQAATMAMQTYYRVKKQVTAALVTAGAGSCNAITGVMSAWADSIPGIIISGQENTRFIKSMKNMRMWGIQGYDSTLMVKKITKYQKRVLNPHFTLFELQKAYDLSLEGRPGPVWLDFPMDIQGSFINKKKLISYKKINKIKNCALLLNKRSSKLLGKNSNDKLIFNAISNSTRPIFWLGHGIRLSSGNTKLKLLLKKYPFPTLLSWAGLDMIEDSHPLNFGSAGVYGNRASNFILQNCDLVISIGNRMSIPMIGYEHSELARNAKFIQVDVDELELKKLKDIIDFPILCDADKFINILIKNKKNINLNKKNISNWVLRCKDYKNNYPKIGPEHKDKNGHINSYSFIDKLCDHLKDNDIITTDMGTALLSGHQAFKIKKNQRLMTSTGLGEMGFGLPAAIGACFANNKLSIINLNCDGGMMINLQELQTIVHHKLPIKIFIFNNDGYLMIKHTQKNLFKGRYIGTDKKSGISCPDYSKVAKAFNIKYFSIRTWKDFKKNIPKIIKTNKTLICDVFMHPEQNFYPKLSLTMNSENKIISPPLEDLSPLLKREKLYKEMIVSVHPKSLEIGSN